MTTRFEFTAEGFDEIKRKLNRGPTEARVVLNDGLREIGRIFVPAKGTGPLADATPKGETGKLARSTFFQISAPGLNQSLVILQPARTPDIYGGDFYGPYVREGTQPHAIRPRFKRWLKFRMRDRETGETRTVFSKGVNHPGTNANPYHLMVFNRLKPQIQRVINRMGARVAAIFKT